MKNLFFLESFITTKIIVFVYWLMLLMSVINGVMIMGYIGGIGGFTTGLFFILLSACLSRVFAEILAVIFRCYEQLKAINENLEKSNQLSTPRD